jgi:LPXTG-motif cell wall-anchored protein
MKHVYRLGLLVGLLALMSSSAYAAPACTTHATNADGTTISSPVPEQAVTSPFTIKGQYFGSFEGVVPIHILDANGGVILNVTAMNECCKLAPYERTITFSVGAPTPACIVVYRESGADATLTPLVQIPITLSPVARMPNTGAATTLAVTLVFGIALALVSAGVLLRRRSRRHA